MTAKQRPRRKRGRLVVFEGPDGTGKTTIARAVGKSLRDHGVACVELAFPGREEGTVGQVVYRLHHDPNAFAVPEITPLGLQALHVAAHVDAIERQIGPALNSGTWVLLDRYWWSTWVYGRVAGAPTNLLEALIAFERRVWGRIEPAPIFLVSRGRSDSTLARTYGQLARAERHRSDVSFLPNNGTVLQAREDVLTALGVS